MTQDLFDAESREHLETIEPNLLELEKNPENLALLNDIFRPMHSLKGASGFLNLMLINKLAHRAENILDALRRGEMVVTPAIMDTILTTTDVLSQFLNNLESTGSEGDIPIDHLVDLLDYLLSSGGQLPAEAGAETVATEPVAEVVTEVAIEAEEPVITEPPAEESAPILEEQTLATKVDENGSTAITTSEWLQSLAQQPLRVLSGFSEAHIKDFIDEALEHTAQMTECLFDLEKDPEDLELLNDIFRSAHNLKGNSGIIQYTELNALTHELETLLNLARQHKMTITNNLVDLFFVVVETMEYLVNQVNAEQNTASPCDTSELLTKLQTAVAGGPIELPEALVDHSNGEESAEKCEQDVEANEESNAEIDEDSDLGMFKHTIAMQHVVLRDAIKNLEEDADQPAMQDALYRALVAIQNSAKFMDFEEVREYADRTAKIVDQARNSDMDFEVVVSLLDQEVDIIIEMAEGAIEESLANATITNVESEQASEKPEEKPEEIPVPAATPAPPVAPAPVQTPPPPPTPAPSVASASTPASPPPPAPPVAPPAAPAPPAKPATPGAAPAKTETKTGSSIRVDYEKLDHLMNLIGELLINRNRYAMITKKIEANPNNVDITTVAQDLAETTYAMARVSDDLQDTLMKVRMLPVSSVFSRFPRLVRDISKKISKNVELVIEGEETELDKSVVEAINDPLMHLIRNSLDHGIEQPHVRESVGKNPTGTVTLRAYHKGNSVVIEVEDDGKGIDPEKMREIAINKKVITEEEAKNLTDQESIELIFAPGFSSAEVITDISGRGVGMDVVRTNIKNLKGNITIQSETGKGSRFILSLPLTLAIIEALMIKMNNQMYAIPLDAVATTTKLESALLTNINGRQAVTLRGEVLGIIDLGELLELPTDPDKTTLSVVILQDNDRRIGLAVDQLLDRQEIVIKPLGAYLNNIKGLAGASIMGDGSVVLILDPHDLYTMATPRSNQPMG